VIGYYVHHQGRGHLHRAMAIAAAMDAPVVGLSSLTRPMDWNGHWIQLPRDDDGNRTTDVTAQGQLHWVPERHHGLRTRMAQISSWINEINPDLMIVDVSVEVALLARLHGVPVITVVLPGDRQDPAHELVHSLARRLIGAWPTNARRMVRGLDEDCTRLVRVGAFSRFDQRAPVPVPSTSGGRRVVVLTGSGGVDVTRDQLAAAEQQTPSWEWVILGEAGTWVDDPWDLLCSAHVVVTHAGENAVAEVAAARRPAVVVPQQRPFQEQDVTAAALAATGCWPVAVFGAFPALGWSDLLEFVSGLDGEDWKTWNDRGGAVRAADLITSELRASADEGMPWLARQ
jgi:hypothetical protein